MKNKTISSNSLVSFLLILLIATACDNSIDGFDDEGGVGTFSVFGFLDIMEDENFIRINDLSNPLLADSINTFDAEVTLLNTESGVSEILEDSVVIFDDIATFNFLTTMDITPETTYRLTVENADGFEQSFEAVTPADAEVTVTPETDYTCTTIIRTRIEPVRSNELLQATLVFFAQGERFTIGADVQQGGDVVRIVFQPSEIVFRRTGGELDCTDDEIDRFELIYTHIGPGFEEILNDFVGLGTEQFVGLSRDTLNFPIDFTQL